MFPLKAMPSTELALNWELAGVVVIFFAGTALHFVFEWSGYWRPIAWLAAVNESTWEHFKLAFWPGVTWAFVEFFAIGNAVHNFWIGKCLGLLCMPLIIAAIFYSYTTALGRHYLWVDIFSFLLAIIIGQLISFEFISAAKLSAHAQWLGVIGIGVMMLVFVLFTYIPPHIFLFEHVPTHEYGILTHY